MKDVHILNSLEEVNVISDPIRLEIIMKLGRTPKTAQDLSDAMDISRSKVHYHLKILEDNGIVEVVDTELINGITQKYFLPVAKAFIPNSELFNNNLEEKVFEIKLDANQYEEFEAELKSLTNKYGSAGEEEVAYQIQIYKSK